MSAAAVAALAIYPVKGTAAVGVESFEIDALGPVGDRRYCLTRPEGRAFTQRDDANLARLRAALVGEGLSLDFDGESLEIGPQAFSGSAQISVWSRSTFARIANGDVNGVLTRWFATRLQLAKLEQPAQRQGATLAFGDAAALLLTNAASLAALNTALEAPLPMNRFRPNIVVGGALAYAEDGWARLRIGSAVLAPVHPCGRCEVTTIDQEFGVTLGDEPLRTLSRLRMKDGEAVFGVRYTVEQPGRVRLGDEVTLLG